MKNQEENPKTYTGLICREEEEEEEEEEVITVVKVCSSRNLSGN